MQCNEDVWFMKYICSTRSPSIQAVDVLYMFLLPSTEDAAKWATAATWNPQHGDAERDVF